MTDAPRTSQEGEQAATVHLEPITVHAHILRVYEHGQRYGDPYTLSAVVLWQDAKTVELAGVDKPIDRAAWIAIARALHERGVETVIARRMRGGREQIRRIPVARWL